jgi:branched-chain amino acid transport system substrate-binding protein
MVDPFSCPTRRQFVIGAAAAATFGGAGLARAASEPFRIGALNPITGAGSPYGTGMQKSILFAAAEVNEAGGAAGRRFEVYAEDSQTNPDAAILAAKKLVEIHKVEAVLGVWSSSAGLAILPYLNDANRILMVSGGATAYSRQRKNDLSWRFMADSFAYGRAFARAARKAGLKRAAVMALNNPSAVDGIDGFSRQWKEWGMDVVGRVVYEPKQVSYRSEVQRVLATNPDVIVAHSFLPDATVFLREWYELGGTNKWVMPGFAANEELAAALGKEVTNDIMAVQVVGAETGAAADRFASKYKEAVGKDVGDNVYAVGCYDMVITLALALEQAGAGADARAVAANIRKVTNKPGTKVSSFAEGQKLIRAGQKIDYDGAFGALDFDENGDPQPIFAVDVLENGKLKRRWTV